MRQSTPALKLCHPLRHATPMRRVNNWAVCQLDTLKILTVFISQAHPCVLAYYRRGDESGAQLIRYRGAIKNQDTQVFIILWVFYVHLSSSRQIRQTRNHLCFQRTSVVAIKALLDRNNETNHKTNVTWRSALCSSFFSLSGSFLGCVFERLIGRCTCICMAIR